MFTQSRFSSASLFVLGLALAACGGGQSEASAEPVATATPATSSALDEESANSGLGDEDSSSTTTLAQAKAGTGTAEADVPGSLPMSELAPGFIELPPAFPERVLDGLGAPIGRPPATLSLPNLGKSGQVFPVGLEPNGELEVPGADDIGWYQFGAGVDGGVGSTVLAAHIAFDGRNGVFSNLAETSIGDEIVVGVDGEDLTYRVISVDQYNKLELPIDDLFSESSEERIVLITCGGSFNPSVRSYYDNVVVVAVPA